MTGQLTHLHIEIGPGGWLKAFWRRDKGAENVVYARMDPPKRKNQAWAIVGLETSKQSNPPWMSAALLRDVPLHRITAAVHASDLFRRDLLKDISKTVRADQLDQVFKRAYRDAPRIKLERPGRSQLDDAFFRQVATAYRQAVAAGRQPGKTMAEDSGIPQGTIARWIAEARTRGFLPAAEKGRISA